MKKFYLFALASVLCLGFYSCDPKSEPTPVTPDPTDTIPVNPDPTDTIPVNPDPTDTIPASFPKKHLIEEFTGQSCGYCPGGMDGISEFVGNDTNWVLVLHHYGYQADNFSVSGSKTITSRLGVNGAPSATINRAKARVGGSNAVVFHPGYLPGTDKSQFETTTYASVVIANQYDEATGELKVHVSGAVCHDDHSPLKLTVLVKESGMVDYQSDYEHTYEGWKEFRHCNAVRAYMTNATGDEVEIDSTRHYAADYTLTLNSKWVAENCMVVAFLSEDFKPVIQAEERPVVSGTKGGSDIEHGGITANPVADYYPEPNSTDGPSAYTGRKAETFDNATAWYEDYGNYTLWIVQAYDQTAVTNVDNTPCIPFTFIYFFTERSTTIQQGEYEFNTSMEPGSAYAGFRDDSQFLIDGSMFYLTSLSYLQQGYLVPSAQWLIADGTLTIGKSDWSVRGHARNGAVINLSGTTAIQNGGRSNAPAKKAERNEKKIKLQ